jgi:hypothetical protein
MLSRPRIGGSAPAGAARDGCVTGSAAVKGLVTFFRQNPQVLVLAIICLVLGIGTFLAVVFGLLTAGSSTTNGEPSGVVAALNALVAALP